MVDAKMEDATSVTSNDGGDRDGGGPVRDEGDSRGDGEAQGASKKTLSKRQDKSCASKTENGDLNQSRNHDC